MRFTEAIGNDADKRASNPETCEETSSPDKTTRPASSVRTTIGIIAGLISGSSSTPRVARISKSVESVELLGEANEKLEYDAVTFSYHICHDVVVTGMVVFGFGAAAMADWPVVVARSLA